MSTIFHETCKAIVTALQEECIPHPSESDWKNISDVFWSKWNFTNCYGAVDGKHVVIRCPAGSGSQYFNYKKTFSIVLLASVDADYNFTVVTVRLET